MPDLCPFCGRLEHPKPIGAPGSMFEAIPIGVCPSIPDGHVYEHRDYPTGPAGRLVRLVDPEPADV